MTTYICQNTVANLPGWNLPRVKKHLGKPDKYEDNPKNYSNRPMKMYSEDRILNAQRTKEFLQDALNSEFRKKKKADRKR